MQKSPLILSCLMIFACFDSPIGHGGDCQKTFTDSQPRPRFLPGFKIGRGSGKTAKALGISEVAHEAKNYRAWKNILFGTSDSHPRVRISRPGVRSERTVGGHAGFYVRVGKTGESNFSGMHARFRVAPEAREGTDFIVLAKSRYSQIEDGQHLVFLNRNALFKKQPKVNESINAIFSKLSSGEFWFWEMAELQYKIEKQTYGLKKRVIHEIESRYINPIQSLSTIRNRMLLSFWYLLPGSGRRIDKLESLRDTLPNDETLIRFFLVRPEVLQTDFGQSELLKSPFHETLQQYDIAR